MDFSEFLKNKPLEEIIRSAPIKDEQKKELLELLPHLNEEERVKVLETMKDVFSLEVSE